MGAVLEALITVEAPLYLINPLLSTAFPERYILESWREYLGNYITTRNGDNSRKLVSRSLSTLKKKVKDQKFYVLSEAKMTT